MILLAITALFLGTSFGWQNNATEVGDIRKIDFSNFVYPNAHSSVYAPHLRRPAKFKLTNGRLSYADQDRNGPLITLDHVDYADLGLSDQTAITTLTYHTGGTMHFNLIYVWTMDHAEPKVIWSLAAGDRAYGGLHNVYGKKGDLVVELDDPKAAMGNCCSRRFVRERYHWNGSRFELAGKPETLPNHEYDNLND